MRTPSEHVYYTLAEIKEELDAREFGLPPHTLINPGPKSVAGPFPPASLPEHIPVPDPSQPAPLVGLEAWDFEIKIGDEWAYLVLFEHDKQVASIGVNINVNPIGFSALLRLRQAAEITDKQEGGQ